VYVLIFKDVTSYKVGGNPYKPPYGDPNSSRIKASKNLSKRANHPLLNAAYHHDSQSQAWINAEWAFLTFKPKES